MEWIGDPGTPAANDGDEQYAGGMEDVEAPLWGRGRRSQTAGAMLGERWALHRCDSDRGSGQMYLGTDAREVNAARGTGRGARTVRDQADGDDAIDPGSRNR